VPNQHGAKVRPKPHGAKVRIAPEARIDLRAALVWSERSFDKAAAGRYRALIQQALRDIGGEPERNGPALPNGSI